jgi:hypothetical protein
LRHLAVPRGAPTSFLQVFLWIAQPYHNPHLCPFHTARHLKKGWLMLVGTRIVETPQCPSCPSWSRNSRGNRHRRWGSPRRAMYRQPQPISVESGGSLEICNCKCNDADFGFHLFFVCPTYLILYRKKFRCFQYSQGCSSSRRTEKFSSGNI